MGKKNRGNRKKEDKKAEKALLEADEKEMRETVRAAMFDAEDQTAPKNVLAEFAPFCKFQRNELDVVIEMFTAETMPGELLDFALKLTETNMKDIYDEAWGWSTAQKKAELLHDSARHIVAFAEGTRTPVAFAHFRFEVWTRSKHDAWLDRAPQARDSIS